MSFAATSYASDPAKRPIPPARLVPALAMIRLFAIRTWSLCWLVSGAGRSGVPTRMAPAYEPLLLWRTLLVIWR